MKKILLNLVIVILLGGILTSCGTTITTNEAEDIVKKWYPQKSDAYAITVSLGVNRINTDDPLWEQVQELKKKGLIDYRPTGKHLMDPNLNEIVIELTDKGKRYAEDSNLSPNAKIFLLVIENFVQVDNVSTKGDYVKIDYTTIYEPIEPFTQEEVERLAPGCLEENVPHTAYFIKEKTQWKQVPYL